MCIRDSPYTSTSTLADSQTLLIQNAKVDEQLKRLVFPHMRADNVSFVAKRDELIRAYGSRYLKTHREKHFVQVTSRKMREISKLFIEIQKTNPNIKNLVDVLKPQYYDVIVECTKKVARYSDCLLYTSRCV